jgi:hypothetical protein
VPELLDFLVGPHASRHELLDEARPLASESVGTSERAVTTADDQSIDTLLDHVVRSRETTLALVESHAASSTDQGTTLGKPASDILPLHLLDHVATVDETLVALVDSVGRAARRNGLPDNSSDGAVHARRVTTRGHDSDLLLSIRHGGRCEADFGHVG